MNFARGPLGLAVVATACVFAIACSSPTPPPLSPIEDGPLDEGPEDVDDEVDSEATKSEAATVDSHHESGDDTGAIEPTPTPAPNGTCSGSPTDATLASLRKRGANSRPCFSALLKREVEARGQVKVVLKLSESGRVDDFDVQGDDPGDVEFTECLAEHFKAPFSDAPPEGGCVTVKIPLNFSVRKGNGS